jgi:NifB/MoaA-like Fe-S oxidoreductase
MAIPTNSAGIIDFLKGNDNLVQEVGDTARDAINVITTLADRIEARRKETATLVDGLGRLPFDVAGTPDMAAAQAQILAKIEDTSKTIQEFRNHPEITTPLLATRAALYVALANTYNNSIRKIVPFTQEEVDTLRVLLRRATLDAAARQRRADVLDAAVQLAKLGLRVAVKVAAA